MARLGFDYGGAHVGWQDGRTELNHVADNRLLVIPRDALAEVQAVERLNAFGLQPVGPTGLGRFATEEIRQDFTFEEDEDDDVSVRWVEFNHLDLPKLQIDGWQIQFGDTYPYQVTQDAPAWDIEVNESGIDWFEIDVGIEVDGERIALLPVLLDLFERAPEEMTPAALDAYGDECVYGTLPDGRLLPIPATRLKAMLEALYEQFAHGRIEDDGRLKLKPSDVSRLAIMDKCLSGEGCYLAWRRAADRAWSPALESRRHTRGSAALGPAGNIAALSARGLELAAVSRRCWLLGCACRRYGPRQDVAGPCPSFGDEGCWQA